jgi:hypothetical protein
VDHGAIELNGQTSLLCDLLFCFCRLVNVLLANGQSVSSVHQTRFVREAAFHARSMLLEKYHLAHSDVLNAINEVPTDFYGEMAARCVCVCVCVAGA